MLTIDKNTKKTLEYEADGSILKIEIVRFNDFSSYLIKMNHSNAKIMNKIEELLHVPSQDSNWDFGTEALYVSGLPASVPDNANILKFENNLCFTDDAHHSITSNTLKLLEENELIPQEFVTRVLASFPLADDVNLYESNEATLIEPSSAYWEKISNWNGNFSFFKPKIKDIDEGLHNSNTL
jgi:hypothetical protein